MFVTFRRFIGAITMHAFFSKVHTRAFYPPRRDRVKFALLWCIWRSQQVLAESRPTYYVPQCMHCAARGRASVVSIGVKASPRAATQLHTASSRPNHP